MSIVFLFLTLGNFYGIYKECMLLCHSVIFVFYYYILFIVKR